MAAPCHSHSSAISELMKRAKSVISRPSFQPPTAFSGERDQPGLIAAVAPLGRCVPATRARPSGRSTADGQVTAHRHRRRRKLGSPVATPSETPLRAGTAKRFPEIRLGGAWHTAPARGGRCSGYHPHMPPFGRSERAFSLRADAWLPRPRAAQPSPNPPDTTPIPTEYKGFKSPGSGTLRMRWRRAVRPLQARKLKRRRTRTSEQHRQQSTTRSAMSDPGQRIALRCHSSAAGCWPRSPTGSSRSCASTTAADRSKPRPTCSTT